MAEGLELFFPLAGPKSAEVTLESRIGRLRCLRGDDAHPVDVSNVKQAIKDQIRAVLLVAREGGTGPRTIPVIIHFLPAGAPLQGTSYQLALAVADRLLRAGRKPDRRIFATGAIRTDGHGEVDDVEGLSDKIATVVEAADSGDVFAFPATNRRDLTPEAVEGLKTLRERGVVVCPVTRLDELGFLWSEAPVEQKDGPREVKAVAVPGPAKLWIAGGVGLLALWVTMASLL